MRHFATALACAIALAAMPARAQTPTIQAIELGTAVSGYDTRATDINSSGVVVGHLWRHEATGSPFKAFLWTRTGGFRILVDHGFATDINDNGVVVGVRYFCGAEVGWACAGRGFRWSASTGAVDIGELNPAAINNKGIIVGSCADTNELRGCMRTASGGVRVLPMAARDVNDRGAVVGYYLRDGDYKPSVWASSFGRRDLNPDPAVDGRAYAINDGGMIAGESDFPPAVRATVWTPVGRAGAPQSDYSFADGISNRGWVVGTAQLRAQLRPVVWLLGGRMVELSTAGVGGHAMDANDAGQIIGWIWEEGTIETGLRARSMLWTVR